MKAVWKRRVWTALLALCLGGAGPAAAQGWRDRFVDEQDGRIDLSNHLLQHRGALPVPIIITEPAVGAGAGAALLYFSESIAGAREKSQARGERLSVPDIGGLAAFKTSNGSQGVAGGYFGTLQGDRFRYLAGAANVLCLDAEGWLADNTDGVLADLSLATRLQMITLIPIVAFMTVAGPAIGSAGLVTLDAHHDLRDGISNMLFEVSASDPLTYLAVTTLVLSVSVLAVLVRVDNGGPDCRGWWPAAGGGGGP